MLDTNVCICAIKHRPNTLIRNFLKHDPEDLCVSAITYAELMHGVEKSQSAERNRLAVRMFLSTISVLDFDAVAAEEYGKIRVQLEAQGKPIGPMDMLIAAHAKAENLIVVTNNTRELYRVEGIEVEDWTQE